MAKEVMHRNASENQYLHKDFHGALSCGIDYLEEHYGPDAVRQYLHDFAISFYAPLRAELNKRGLAALKQHFEEIYRIEAGRVEFEFSPDELLIRVEACPAVMHMREHGYPVARMFDETTRSVNDAICEGTPFVAELLEYYPDTGRSVQRFYRRMP